MDDGLVPRMHVAGNAVVDLRVVGGDPKATVRIPSWARGSVRLLDAPLVPVLGGTAATACLLGRLGVSVSLNAPVGTDPLGAIIRDWLTDAGVRLAARPAGSTAVNVILVDPDGTPHWHYHAGARVDWHQSLADGGETDWFYATGYGHADADDLAQLGGLFAAFRARGVRVAFDPGPWLFLRAGREAMERAWADVDCLIGTETELSTWHGGPPAALVRHLLARGPRQVVVKRGADGAAWGSAGDEGSMPTEPVARASAVGAGDTFNAALLNALARGSSLCDAVSTAVRLATAAVARGRCSPDTSMGAPS